MSDNSKIERTAAVSAPRRGEWEAWIGRRVRVYPGPTQLPPDEQPWAEGEIIGVCEAPSIIVLHDDGTRSHHSSSLPIEFETWVPA